HLRHEAPGTSKGTIDRVYGYRDEHGDLLYQAVRYEPKGFSGRRPDGRGGWVQNLNGTRRVLYRLPELTGSSQIFVVEGEKDVDRLVEAGIKATTNIGGAGKWRKDYTDQLLAAGVRSVVVIPDNDPPGQEHALTVAQSCHGAGLAVKLIRLLDVP